MTETSTFVLNCHKGWNLISLPVNIDSLPQSFSLLTIFEYENGHYGKADSLQPGKGYWVKAPYDMEITLKGVPFSNYTKELSQGWHLVGAVDHVFQPNFSSDDGVISICTYQNGRYHRTDSFEPGLGYWVKVEQKVVLTVGTHSIANLLTPEKQENYEKMFKDQLISYMEKIVDNKLEKALEVECSGYYDDPYIIYARPLSFGFDSINSFPSYYADPHTNIVATGTSTPPEDNSANEYSETNNQIAGVDEADFIKNDGSYIYILADNQFQIIDAWPPENASVISRFNIEGTPKKLFVHENRAVIYSSLENIYRRYYDNDDECTYGYNCDFIGDGKKIKITVLDLSDVYHPVLLRELSFNGSYINSRRIENAVYSVILFPEPYISGVKYEPDLNYCETDYFCYRCNGWWCSFQDDSCYLYSYNRYSDEEIKGAFEELKQKNRNLIMAANISGLTPMVRDTRYVNGSSFVEEKPLNQIKDIYFSNQQDGMNFMSIFSFDINAIESNQSITVIGKPGAVYASSKAIYIASRHIQYPNLPWFSFRFWDSVKEATTIHKFQLKQDPAQSSYIGSGAVKGRVLNQFSMDEYNGFFRIATTIGRSPSIYAHNTLSVLEQSLSGDLVPVGTIDNIAPTEDIRSVRFNGDKGFIVTFKKTDPLFTVDLSNPYDPKILGELHIPGFSTYIHLMDDNHLLSIGYDGDDQGNFSLFQGIILQIFDISDMSYPILTHKEVIGTRGTTSEAATNHLAFNYFKPKDLLAIPMAICEGESGGRYYGDVMTFNGLMIYKATTGKGFTYLGGVDHGEQSSCSNWWTNSNSQVKRSIFMDDYVFSVTEEEIRVDMLSELGEDISVIDLVE